MLKPTISFPDFAKLDLRIGQVTEASEVPGSDKLLRLIVDLGEEVGKRVILTGIKEFYSTKDLLGKLVVIVVNLEPKKMMGEESQGMMLAAVDEKPIILKPSKKVKPGTIIR